MTTQPPAGGTSRSALRISLLCLKRIAVEVLLNWCLTYCCSVLPILTNCKAHLSTTHLGCVLEYTYSKLSKLSHETDVAAVKIRF